MNEDIESLVSELYKSDCEPKDIRETINKALELAAKECEKRFMGDLNREDMEARCCAEAIRKLKEKNT